MCTPCILQKGVHPLHVDDHRPKPGPTRDDHAARRILNLLFLLNVSRSPLTTEQILSAEELGYGGGNRDSALKKFRRDREKLAEQGVIVREIHPEGTPETESSLWAIDREATHADRGLILQEDAETLVDIIDDHLMRADIPYRGVLSRIRTKVLEAAGRLDPGTDDAGGGASAMRAEGDPVLETIWAAFALRRRLPMTYQDAEGHESQRTVAIFGIFTLEGRCYFVGEDEEGRRRTFRADRVLRAKRPRGPYAIPADFDVDDYLFLPFDFAPGTGTEVTFSLDLGATDEEIKTATRGRGAVEEQEGRRIWRVRARDVRAAAAWGLSHHAPLTVRPVDPPELVEAWNDLVRKAVGAHA